MTNPEFSNEFDILYNNVMSNQAPGLDEYEKSVFLTKAQHEIVKAYFSSQLNKAQEGFDDSPVRQADFSTIISSATVMEAPKDTPLFDRRAKAFIMPEDVFISLNEQIYNGTKTFNIVPVSFVEYARLTNKPYKYPPKNQAWKLISNDFTSKDNIDEALYKYTIGDQKYTFKTQSKYGKPVRLIVKTSTYTDFPYGNIPTVEETKYLVTITCKVKVNTPLANYWRLFISDTSRFNITEYFEPFDGSHSSWPSFTAPADDNVTLCDVTNPGGEASYTSPIAEIIGRFNNDTLIYKIRYVKKLKPIILVDLNTINDSLSIEGQTFTQVCELPSELHEDILQRAVELAKAAYSGDLQSQIALGQASATDKGVVQQSR